MLSEIEEEAAAKRGDRPVLGAEKILSEDPCRRPLKTKKSPAPMLFFAKRREVREAQVNDYKDFVDDYELAADRLIKAAFQGHRLDFFRHFPSGSFPPALISELMKAARGFNPEEEFPKGSFPRPWPFVGGRLRSAPPTPPTRQLIYKDQAAPTVVARGEIPIVRVPRREVGRHKDEIVASFRPVGGEKAHVLPPRCLARDPP